MPLPTPPSKLGNLLPPDEYKARARTTRSTRKAATETTPPMSPTMARRASPNR